MRIDFRTLAIFAALILMSVPLGFHISRASPLGSLGIVAGVVIFTVSFLNVEFAIYMVILSMLLSPEFAATEGGIIEGRSIVIRLEDLLLVLIGFSWFARMAVDKSLGLILKTPLNKFILFYVLVLILATVFGAFAGNVQPKSAFFYILKYVEYYVVYFITVNYLKDTSQAKRFLFIALVVTIIVSVYAIGQMPTGMRVSAPFEGEHGEANTLGGYLLFMMSVVLGLMLNVKDRKALILFAAMLPVIAIPFMATLSRSSWVGLIPMCAALLYFGERKLILTLGLVLILAASPLLMTKQVKERALQTVQGDRQIPGTRIIAGITLDQSTSDRFSHFEKAFKMWMKRPVFGYGVTGGFMVDSQIFRVMVEAGLVGLVAFFLLLRAIFSNLRDNLKKVTTPFGKGVTLGVLAGFFGLTGHCIGASTFIIVRIMEPFWLLVAIAIMMPELEEQDTEKAAQKEEPSRVVGRSFPVRF